MNYSVLLYYIALTIEFQHSFQTMLKFFVHSELQNTHPIFILYFKSYLLSWSAVILLFFIIQNPSNVIIIPYQIMNYIYDICQYFFRQIISD